MSLENVKYPSLPLLVDSLWPWMVEPDGVLCIDQIELSNHLLYLIIDYI